MATKKELVLGALLAAAFASSTPFWWKYLEAYLFPPKPGLQLIKITDATYATPDGAHKCNAADRVKTLCEDKRACSLLPNNAYCGDPFRGTPKVLTVRYSCSGETREALIIAESTKGELSCE